MLRRFCETQNLFSVSAALPKSLRVLALAFVRRFKPTFRGTLITDSLVEDAPSLESDRPTQTPLDEETASLLEDWKSRNADLSASQTPRKATYHKCARHNGSELKPGNVSFSDSLVVVGTEEIWSAAQIENIFDVELYPKGKREFFTLLKVRYFEEMTAEDVPNDIYRHFDGMGRIVYADGDSCKKEVVPISRAISHFAMTESVRPKIIRTHAHVLPLFRVSKMEILVSQDVNLTFRCGVLRTEIYVYYWMNYHRIVYVCGKKLRTFKEGSQREPRLLCRVADRGKPQLLNSFNGGSL